MKDLVFIQNDQALSIKEKVALVVKNVQDTFIARLINEKITGEANLEYIPFAISEISNIFYQLDHSENPVDTILRAFEEIEKNMTPKENKRFGALIRMAHDYILIFFKLPSLKEDKKLSDKCVYVLEMDNGTVKIGVTSDFAKRGNTIMGSSGATIVRKCRSEYMSQSIAVKIEHTCHEIFKLYRLKGEFFKITFEAACDELQKYTDIAFLD